MTKKRLLVTASNTDCGKTYLSLKILRELARKGLRVGAMKPIETGVTTLPEDGKALYECCLELNPDFHTVTLDDVVPVQYALPAAPQTAKGDEAIDFDAMRRSLAKIETVSDIVLIESAGGLMTPIEDDFFVVDLAEFFDATVLFFTTDKLGMISESLVNLAFLKQRGITPHWGINCFGTKENFDTINRPFLATHFEKLYLLPEDMEAYVSELLG